MTTAELIKLLQQADPDGTTPVCIDNADIYFVDRMPAFWDGRLEQLVHDETKRGKAWSIVGARVIRSGEKIKIKSLSIQEVFIDHPDLPVECSDSDRGQVEAWRKQARDL